MIDSDIRCPGCGYNLRGLNPSDRCPECELPVDAALGPCELGYAEPAWLESLIAGARLASAGFLAGGASVTVAAALRRPAFRDSVVFAVLLIVAAAACALMLAGVWRFTAPIPTQRRDEPVLSARHMARLFLTLAALGMAAAAAVARTATGWMTAQVSLLGGLFFLIALLSLARHVERLAEFAGDGPLHNRAGLYRRVLGICAIFGVLAWWATSVGPPPTTCVLIVVCIIGLFPIGLIVVLPLSMLGGLRAALAHSRELRQRGRGTAAAHDTSRPDSTT